VDRHALGLTWARTRLDAAQPASMRSVPPARCRVRSAGRRGGRDGSSRARPPPGRRPPAARGGGTGWWARGRRARRAARRIGAARAAGATRRAATSGRRPPRPRGPVPVGRVGARPRGTRCGAVVQPWAVRPSPAWSAARRALRCGHAATIQ
jgi:hypothetical protein